MEKIKNILRSKKVQFGTFAVLFLGLFLTSFTKGSFETYDDLVMEVGNASYYAGKFLGRKTASGEIFSAKEYTCAHKFLPFGTLIKVTNLSNLKSVIVRINDRGPFSRGRIVDLSYMAAKDLGLLQRGVAEVAVEMVHQQYSEPGNVEQLDRVRIENTFAYINPKNTDRYNSLIDFLIQSDSETIAPHAKIDTSSSNKS